MGEKMVEFEKMIHGTWFHYVVDRNLLDVNEYSKIKSV